MLSKGSKQINHKQLMKIIYEKEGQIEKYRRMLREQEQARHICREYIESMITLEQKQSIVRQFQENRQFFRTANQKMDGMQCKILSLQSQLHEEENKNHQLETQLVQLRKQLSSKDKILLQLEVQKEVGEKSQNQLKQQYCEAVNEINSLKIDNSKIKLQAEEIKRQKEQLKNNIQHFDGQFSNILHLLTRRINKKISVPKSKQNISVINSSGFLSNRTPRSQANILSQHYLTNHTQARKLDLQQKTKQTIKLLQQWEDNLTKREEDLKHKFQKSICEHSFEGVSHLLSETQIGSKPKQVTIDYKDQMLETSEYLRNQQQFLKQLQEECQQQIPGREYSYSKQKIIELEQVKQTLQHTKQINETLFQQLNQQEKTIKVFKQSFQNLSKKKLLINIDATEEIKNLRAILGIKY